MTKLTLSLSAALIVAAVLLPEHANARPFNCARAKKGKFCRYAKYAVKGCFWCDNRCGHFTECESAKPVCEKLKAFTRKQKLICKAQGCNVVGRKCVSTKVDATPSPTKAPTTCKHPIRIIKGQVDKSGYCTKKCPCEEYEGDCDADNQCKGDLVCVKESGKAFDLDEDFDVCMRKDATKKPTPSPTPFNAAKHDKDVEEKIYESAKIPALDDLAKNPKLILELPEQALSELGDLEDKVKKDPSLIELNSINRFSFATRTPAMMADILKEQDVISVVKDLCIRKNALGRLGYCTKAKNCQCGEGEGWCRSDAECEDGLVCRKKHGAYYGLGKTVAVCVREEGRPDILEDGNDFEGDIDIETTHTGINLIAKHYGTEHAQDVVNAFPKSAFPGSVVTPKINDIDLPINPSITLPPFEINKPTEPEEPVDPIIVNPDLINPDIINPNIINPDILNIGGLRGGRPLMNARRNLGAIEEPDMIWPNGIMYYTFDKSVTSSVKKVILDAMDHWKSKTCITFVPRNNQHDYVRFVQPSKVKCSSAIGRDGGRQTINLHQACGFGAAVHEIMHALGFYHEQSRPDRDSFIDIHWDNIKFGKGHNFWRSQNIESHGSDYDYGSIMHYSSHAFSDNKKATITPKIAGATIGQRSGLSDHDVWQIKKLYNCLSQCPNGYTKKEDYFGTAPFCDGECPNSAWREIGRHEDGGGHWCLTGSKAHCSTCCKKVTTTVYKWYGTAPFCDGECPSGWTYVKKSKTGGGSRCWTGWKRQCKKVQQQDSCVKPDLSFDPSCPPGGNRVEWFGTAPFCKGACPAGWQKIRESSSFGLTTCWTGTKVQCRRSC